MFFKIFVYLHVIFFVQAQYQPNWESLDTRPLPKWLNSKLKFKFKS